VGNSGGRGNETSLSDSIEQNGVVGAGGAGFPTAAKLRRQAETYIVNAAECEPLLHKDKELLLHHSAEMLAGLRTAMERVGARHGIIGIKEKYDDVIRTLAPLLANDLEICPLRDVYPAGDEFILVFDVTGRVIPPGGLPLDVGVVVSNVETLVNVARNRPVTHKYLTVAGAVADPVTLHVPVGMAIGEVVAAAGGATVGPFEVLMGGAMMARLARGLEEPVTKTTGGLLVLPREHALVRRYLRSWPAQDRIGKSACDQCSFCTELCPRYLLGHPIEPHKAMRALGFAPDKDRLLMGTLYCCECNLCSLFSCPEDLDPKDVCAHDKKLARERGLGWQGRPEDLRPHPLSDQRRIPTHRLMAKLGLTGFRNLGPLEDRPLAPRRVAIPLRQHVGVPCVATVRPGESVRAGDLIAAPPAGQLGANIHASISGRVGEIDGAVVIEA
jgi:Na+-translocating ferredoxin:NAD+ oxidoreductase RnfC subunit